MIVDRLMRPAARRDLSLDDPKAWSPSLWSLAGSQSLSGETVTEATALTYSAVWCAVRLISETIASLPLHLMQGRDGRKRVAEDYRLYRLMHDAPNGLMTARDFRAVQMAHVLTWGNGYAEIVRSGTGEVLELWPIPPHRVAPKARNVDGQVVLEYEISVDRGTVVLPRRKILHIPGLGYDGLVGYSPIAMARKSLGLGMAMETFGARFFGAGTNPGVVVSHPTALSPQAHSNLRTSLTEAYSGLGNTHRLLLLEEGMKIEKVGIPPNDSQFLESRQHQVTEVARWFNLPPHKLKDLTRSSFSNIESEQRSFYTDSLLPWLVALEQQYALQLLSPSDKDLSGRGRLYFKHSAEGILRADAASRSAFYATMVTNGIMSRNEVRALEDLEPVAGGDVLTVQLNMTTLDKVGQEPPPAPPAPEQEPEDEPESEQEPEA